MQTLTSRRTLLTGIGGLGAAALTAAAAPSATALTRVRPTTGHWRTYTYAGRTATYHVYANGIDWTRTVGVLWYFDGDYHRKEWSRVLNPTGVTMTAMAAEANRRNLVLVAVATPSAYSAVNGWTWWAEMQANGDFVRAFAAWFNGAHTVSLWRQWMLGYSGGAELISKELMSERQTSWMTFGGAIMIGGGGRPYSYSDAAVTTTYRSLHASWVVGSLDVAGSTNPVTWSALDNAKSATAFFLARGYTRARLTTLAGIGHGDYDIPGEMRAPLDRAGVVRLR